MLSGGIDIGSRTIKTVLLEDGHIREWEVVDATSRPFETAQKLLSRFSNIPVVASGYGRGLLEIEEIPSVTEIKACARGVRYFSHEARLIIDIGGQDLKVILLDDKGKITKFEMNDRCAAGTGKFLEIMADKLDYNISEFGSAALTGRSVTEISSMCTVFAESEVIGLLNRGLKREDVAYAVHKSVVKRLVSMCKRVVLTEDTTPIYLAGGGALNDCLAQILENDLNREIMIPANPRIAVALGAACLAGDLQKHSTKFDFYIPG